MQVQSFNSLDELFAAIDAALSKDRARRVDITDREDTTAAFKQCGCANCVARRAAEGKPADPTKREPVITDIEFNNIMLMLRDFVRGVGGKHGLLNKQACVIDAVGQCMPPARATRLFSIPGVFNSLWLDALGE